jgi:hypothetical protein
LQLDRVVPDSERETPCGGIKGAKLQKDLEAHGFSAGNPLDLVVVAQRGGGNNGGLTTFFGRQAGFARYSTDTPFVVIHEVNHCIDAIFDSSRMPQYDHSHGLWFVNEVIKGLDATVNAEIPRKMSPANILGLAPPFGSLVSVVDADGDGVSEDTRLPVHEAKLGGSPLAADSDGDGLTDREEMERAIFANTNPGNADTDGDGPTQGNDKRDRNPLLAMNGYVAKGTPTINGTFSATEGWTKVMDGVNFQNAFFPHTSKDFRDVQEHLNTKIWSAWDDQAVYFAFEFTRRADLAFRDRVHLRLDLDNQGWYSGLAKHYLVFDNTTTLHRNGAHGMTQDISSIVGGGEWAEIFDDADPWKSAAEMNLSPLFDRAGFVFRVSSLGGDRYYAELKIPAGNRRRFLPASGKVINFLVFHETVADVFDSLMELDNGARLLLVDPVDTDGDGVWDQQEIDIGRDPLSPG